MKVLVTGGSGKIGSYVVGELQAHHHVTIFSRRPQPLPGVNSFAGDILNLAQVKVACRGHDAIVHLAAIPNPSGVPADELLRVNVMGTINVLEAAVQEGLRKVVVASSNAATGYWAKDNVPPDYFPLDEKHPCRPRDPYALSKYLNEITCQSYTAEHGLSTICLRISGRYLDRPGATLIVPSREWGVETVEQLWDKFLLMIDDPARARWSFWVYCDARDVASAFCLALENEAIKHSVYFITAADSFTRLESQVLLSRFFPGVPVRGAIKGYTTLISHHKATEELGWTPRYSWRDCAYLLSGGKHA